MKQKNKKEALACLLVFVEDCSVHVKHGPPTCRQGMSFVSYFRNPFFRDKCDSFFESAVTPMKRGEGSTSRRGLSFETDQSMMYNDFFSGVESLFIKEMWATVVDARLLLEIRTSTSLMIFHSHAVMWGWAI